MTHLTLLTLVIILCSLATISRPVKGTVPGGITCTKNYTFRFVHFNQYYTASITITPKTNGTHIKIPCTNDQELLNSTAKSFNVSRLCSNDSVQIFASADVIVHGKISSSNGLTAGFLVLPDDELGTEYLVDCYTPINRTAQVAISAISNDTIITVNCTSNCTFNQSLVSGSFRLGAGESGILTSVKNETDMTGTYIRSNKPISVVVGAFNVYIPRESTNKGHGVVLEQLLPISAWGLSHIVPPFRDTPNGWILRISAINSSTNVSLTDCGIRVNASLRLNSREFNDIPVNGTSRNVCLIEADQPIQVMQYVASSSAKSGIYGDPSMTIIPAISRYHGDTIVSVTKGMGKEFNYSMDVVTTSQGQPMINGSTAESTNGASLINETSLVIDNKRIFLYTFELQLGTYHVTRPNQSGRMWVRLYTLHETLGAAMLGDVRLSVSLPSVGHNDKTTDIQKKEDELKKKQKEFEDQFPGNFPRYDVAAEALDTVTSCLVERGELESVIETEIALEFFKGVLTRKPLMYATVNETKSFLNKTSDALNVLFSNKTKETLVRACAEKRNLSVSPEEIQYELEGLLNNASELIVGGGLSSFGVSRENAAIMIASTNMTSRDNEIGVSHYLAECEGALDIPGYGVKIPCEVLAEMGSRAVYQMSLTYGADALASSKCSKNRTQIATSLLSVGLVSNEPKQKFSKNISLNFTLRPSGVEVNNKNVLCSFWDNDKGDWSTSGCSLLSNDVIDNKVTCVCNHLTSFAVLIDVTPGEIGEKTDQILELLTWIGCGISILACFLTCIGYVILRLRSDLILVHGNLALSVGLAETAFLCLDAIPNPHDRPISCLILACVIYYHFIAMFAWMAIEGIHLYLLTFVVWNAEKRKIKCYMACGWGIPFLFVAMPLAYHFTRPSGENIFQNYCFLSFSESDKSLLLFVVPVAVVIVFNIFVTIRVVVQIVKMSDGPTMQGDIKTRAKYGVKAMIVLLPIMGLTWVVGFLAVNGAKVIFLYAFVVLNCLQGVFIFFIHFFRNSEVRKAFRRRLDKWAVSQSFKGDSSSSRNVRKSSSSGGEKNLEIRSPNQTITLSNMWSTRPHNL